MTLEGIRINFRNKVYIPLTCKRRNQLLTNKEFTIISNNCWGGTVYEAYHLQKQSPTIGLFFMAEDYIKFVSKLKLYLEMELQFIKPEETKWKNHSEIINSKNFGSYPVGVLGDIEIFFLHNHSEEEAKAKWERRIKRINWDKLLVKFNDQNGCTARDVSAFLALPYKNKIFFTCRKWPEFVQGKCIVTIRQPAQYSSIKASYEPFGLNKINIPDILNNL